ncbi:MULTISPECIES: GatB/YqeY domain-containing protein [unclassified Lebetimonas]|uniref:GatB/YqeY domain-containing protein n=1 Tax=unclassified Lebetimonas TaxID=2648158 RepID=UPI0004652F4B|nr:MULTISPECIES: GatB/YqeY domain-containing protein [unclassified Lebetimonas]
MTIIELKKMMIKAKKEDKTKANALMMLVDTAQKLAKSKNEEISEKHIIEAARKLAKMAKESIDAGMEEAKKELSIYEEFLPKMLSEEESKKIIEEIINEIGGKNIGEIMKRLKQRGDIDLGLANKIIKSI